MVRNQQPVRNARANVRRWMVCCALAAVTGCGRDVEQLPDAADTPSITVADRASVATGGAVSSTLATNADMVVLVPSTTTPFTWDASADIAGFPSEHYELVECVESSAVRESGEISPVIDTIGGPLFANVDELRSHAGTVFVATVDQVGSPFTVTPINLPDEYTAATGVVSGADISWSWTPTTMTVDRVLWGEADATVVMGELGCYAEGATAALSPGATLLVLAERIDPAYGPFVRFDGTHLIVDWFAVNGSRRLTPRTGLTGMPPSAPFLEGLELGEALALLAADP